jgi:hypothetical protein
MSMEHFELECTGCKPAMMDVKTGKVLPDDSPEMQVVLRVWNDTPIEDRRAWHRFTCLNSRAAADLQFAASFTERIQRAFTHATSGTKGSRK